MTKAFTSFGAFGRHLERLALEGPAVTDHLLHLWGEHVKQDAKDRIGHRQPGWEELAPETMEFKARFGYHGPDYQPLLLTGEMYGSIDFAVVDGVAVVGSTDIKALWHELGTSRVPPRPFIGPAAHESRKWFMQQSGITLLAWLGGVGWKQGRAPK